MPKTYVSNTTQKNISRTGVVEAWSQNLESTSTMISATINPKSRLGETLPHRIRPNIGNAITKSEIALVEIDNDCAAA